MPISVQYVNSNTKVFFYRNCGPNRTDADEIKDPCIYLAYAKISKKASNSNTDTKPLNTTSLPLLYSILQHET